MNALLPQYATFAPAIRRFHGHHSEATAEITTHPGLAAASRTADYRRVFGRSVALGASFRSHGFLPPARASVPAEAGILARSRTHDTAPACQPDKLVYSTPMPTALPAEWSNVNQKRLAPRAGRAAGTNGGPTEAKLDKYPQRPAPSISL